MPSKVILQPRGKVSLGKAGQASVDDHSEKLANRFQASTRPDRRILHVSCVCWSSPKLSAAPAAAAAPELVDSGRKNEDGTPIMEPPKSFWQKYCKWLFYFIIYRHACPYV